MRGPGRSHCRETSHRVHDRRAQQCWEQPLQQALEESPREYVARSAVAAGSSVTEELKTLRVPERQRRERGEKEIEPDEECEREPRQHAATERVVEFVEDHPGANRHERSHPELEPEKQRVAERMARLTRAEPPKLRPDAHAACARTTPAFRAPVVHVSASAHRPARRHLL